MSSRALRSFLALAIIAASVAMPFAVHYRLHARARETDETLRKQAGELSQLVKENNRLSNSVAQVNAQSLSVEQLQELLRLRGEVGTLRERTNELGSLQAENQRLEAGSNAPSQLRPLMSQAELDGALATETREAMKNVLAALPVAIQAYVTEHSGQRPTNFYQLRESFPTSGGRRMIGLYSFQFVRDEGPQSGDALVLRESSTHEASDGTSTRLYAFSDGTITNVSSPSDNFEAWEKEHLGSPPPAR